MGSVAPGRVNAKVARYTHTHSLTQTHSLTHGIQAAKLGTKPDYVFFKNKNINININSKILLQVFPRGREGVWGGCTSVVSRQYFPAMHCVLTYAIPTRRHRIRKGFGALRVRVFNSTVFKFKKTKTKTMNSQRPRFKHSRLKHSSVCVCVCVCVCVGVGVYSKYRRTLNLIVVVVYYNCYRHRSV